METATISSKYQIVIPHEIREIFHIKPWQKHLFIPYKNTLRIVILPPSEPARGMFKGLDRGKLREEVDEQR
jgi:bifunctional DNA-binding transcriptional regulator/antitoxin component of YhaV-PrlF toxin-antitoxin module